MSEIDDSDTWTEAQTTRADGSDSVASSRDEIGRIEAIDVLRGVALLGILLMNIRFFALPLLNWNDPVQWWHPPLMADVIAWAVGQLLFEHEMIALFSMLFGAGIWMMSANRLASGALHYRRMFWLLVIGHAHAFLLWYGDILMAYAVCGALVFPLRRLSPRWLIALGVMILCVAPLIRAAPHLSAGPGATDEVARTETADPDSVLERWRQLAREEPSARRAGYTGMLRWRAQVNLLWHYQGFHRFTGWLAGGFMLLGMGFARCNLLDGSRATRDYARLALAGYAVGLPVVAFGVHPQLLVGTDLELPRSAIHFALQYPMRYLGGAAVAMGHLGAIQLLYRATPGRQVWKLLARVGRMSLSAYLLQSLICAVLFDFWGFGLWGRFGHAGLAGIVVSIWIVELVLCFVWLEFFRLGPAEWLWRSLAYGAREPMLASGTGSR